MQLSLFDAPIATHVVRWARTKREFTSFTEAHNYARQLARKGLKPTVRGLTKWNSSCTP